MDLQLTDKLAVVTGSTKGIGLAIATSLAREGARVVVNGRTEAAVDTARNAITSAVPDAKVEAQGGGGHYTIEVVSPVFEGKSMLESQRLVLGAIKHLMAGELAPVHAVDSIKTRPR